MARLTKKLTAVGVKTLTKTGYHSDGDGLYLQVSASGAKSWIFRYRFDGKAREMGLGSLNALTLAEARERAKACRVNLLDDIDPITARTTAVGERRTKEKQTFTTVAEQYFAAKKIEFANPKHAAQWISTLRTYAYPVIGEKPIGAINLATVTDVLAPIWETKNETASRLRGRMEAVLAYAKTLGLRSGDNPATWTNNLDKIFPAPARVQKLTAKNMPALPYREIGAFMQELRQQQGIAAKALEFTILTAARSGETFGATWAEFDMDAGLWIIPANRMKAGKEHRVPLTPQVMAILHEMEVMRSSDTDFVFQGKRTGGPNPSGLSNMAMSAVLKRMGRKGIVPHGFRSTFRDWAAETTDTPHQVCEMALAHAIGNDVEAAYRRGDLLIKRQKLMQAWADYCDRATPAAVVSIASAASSQVSSAIEGAA